MLLSKMLKMNRKNNRGSAIIIVLVAVSFVFVLISTILYITLANIMMKYSDSRIKDNFYSSEMVLEQMKAGLQNEASTAFSSVYRTTLTYYSPTGETKELKEVYLSKLYSQLRKGDTELWDEEKLKNFVDPGLWANVDQTLFDEGNDGAGERPHKIEKTSNGVILRNIYIKYTSKNEGKEKNMVSVIQTDFTIGNMTGSYAASSSIPAVFEYAIIAGKDFRLNSGTKVESKKNIYGGDNFVSIGDPAGNGTGGASLKMDGLHMLVTKGTISLNGTAPDGASLQTGPRTIVVAHDIHVNKNGSAQLEGTTEIFNDIKYFGPGTMKIKGNYIGFGDSVSDPSASSAVLLNSKGAKFDSSEADLFILSGVAFVGENTGSDRFAVFDTGDDVTVGGYDNTKVNFYDSTLPDTSKDPRYKSVPTAQSISSKANQVAYLIPPECIGVSVNEADRSNNQILVGENPVTGVTSTGAGVPDLRYLLMQRDPAKYPTISDVPNIATVDFDTPLASLSGNTLRNFSDKYAVRYIQSQYGENLAYFYIIIEEPEKARDYLKAYNNRNRVRSDKYFRFYTDEVKTSIDDQKMSTFGEYYTASTTGAELHDRTGYRPSDAINILGTDYEHRFYSLCARLEDNVTNLDEIRDINIFDNVLKTKRSAAPGLTPNVDDVSGKMIYTVGKGEDQIYGVLINGDCTYGDGSLGVDDELIRLVISTGNVTVKKNFKGLIIARGDIICDGNIVLEEERTGVARILQTTTLKGGGTGEKLIDYFIDGYKYQFALDGIATETQGAAARSESENKVDYGTLVHYENYTKK